MARRHEAEFLEELVSGSGNGGNSREFIDGLARKHGLRPSEAENISSFYTHSERKVKVCSGLPCAMKKKEADRELLNKYPDEEVEEVSCLGYCDHAPVALSQGVYYQIGDGGTRELDPHSYSRDFRVVSSVEDYLAMGGFGVLQGMINGRSGEELLEQVKEFNLRGFGGSGFPAYVKWKAVHSSGASQKYLLVNAHEGEPGTFKDRILMETNPFELIEASFVSSMVVGASKVIVALKHEYIEAEKALKGALKNSLEYLGPLKGSMKLPEISIQRVPGYYITGEESALMEAIEGRRSEPRLRPPYPAEIGLYGKPTLIDNVETLLYLLGRLRAGNRDASGKGEKSYCLTGDVSKPGSYRLPYGSPSTELIHGRGGSELSEFKALLPGGLSGGILPAGKGDIQLDFDSVKSAGAGMGTGSMIAVSKDRCMVTVMDNVEAFFEKESCGKCMPCRYGTEELSGLFRKLRNGEASEGDISSAEKTAAVMLTGSICGLGQASAKMFLDAVKYFREEIQEHVSGKCPSSVCFQEAR